VRTFLLYGLLGPRSVRNLLGSIDNWDPLPLNGTWEAISYNHNVVTNGTRLVVLISLTCIKTGFRVSDAANTD